MTNFSFQESENSFPSSHNNSAHRRETENSKKSSFAKKTPDFSILQSKKVKREGSARGSKKYANQSKHLKNHLRSIARLVGADQNFMQMQIPTKNVSMPTRSDFRQSKGKIRGSISSQGARSAIEIQSLPSIDDESSSSNSQLSQHEPPSMKMIGVQGRVTTKSSGSKEETKFNIKITAEERKGSSSFIAKQQRDTLMIPKPRERRRLSENPRNINLLHDIPRQTKRLSRKRKSTRSARSVGKQVLRKLLSLK